MQEVKTLNGHSFPGEILEGESPLSHVVSNYNDVLDLSLWRMKTPIW